MKKEYKVIIELYNDYELYKADYFEYSFDNIENAFNYMINILNEIINDKQLNYKSIAIKENNKIINKVSLQNDNEYAI